MDSFAWNCSIYSLGTGSHRTTSVLRDDRDYSNVLDAEWGQAIATESLRNSGSNLAYGGTVLACRTLEAGVSCRGGRTPGSRTATRGRFRCLTQRW
jgi:hypothetical protein